MSNIAIADIYLMGHDHRRGCVPCNPRIHLTSTSPDKELHVKEKTPWLGRTGSFLKAYEDGRKSYNVDAGRGPASLGWIEFEITPIRNRRDGGDTIDIQIRGTS